jgi:hypothetical protein
MTPTEERKMDAPITGTAQRNGIAINQLYQEMTLMQAKLNRLLEVLDVDVSTLEVPAAPLTENPAVVS